MQRCYAPHCPTAVFMLNKMRLTPRTNSTVCCDSRSDKKTLCSESAPGKKNSRLSSSAVPPPIPMSPIVEKMEGLKSIRNRSNSLRLGRLAFYRHLEKVGTMRSFWELKHEEMEGGKQKVRCTSKWIPPRSDVWVDRRMLGFALVPALCPRQSVAARF